MGFWSYYTMKKTNFQMEIVNILDCQLFLEEEVSK